jgi:hypothetical protein
MKETIDLDKVSKRQKKFLSKTGKSLDSQIALQLVRDGAIIPDGKTDEQLVKEVSSFIRTGFAQKTIRFEFGIDYTRQLLTDARRLFRQGKLELSALYFATFFEHKLNWLITEICRKNQIDDLMIAQLLREASVRAKCTWILALLGHKPVQSNLLNAITALNEIRNSFIHYKWPNKETDPQKLAKLDEQMLGKLKKAENVIRYLRKFEEGQLYKGHGKRVRRLISTRSSSPGNSPKIRRRLAAVPK